MKKLILIIAILVSISSYAGAVDLKKAECIESKLKAYKLVVEVCRDSKEPVCKSMYAIISKELHEVCGVK